MKMKVQPKTGIVSVVVHTPGGTRSISTGTKDKKEAAALVKAANVQTIEVLSKAGKLNQALIQKLTLGGTMTVEEAVGEWERWLKETANSDRTADTNTLFVRAWMRKRRLAERKLVSVTAADINQWVNDKDAGKMSTRMVKLASIRSLFLFCSIREYCWPDPSREVRVKAKLLSHDQKEPRKKRCFTDEEFVTLVDYIMEHIVELMSMERTDFVSKQLDIYRFWYAATIIGRYAGMRLGDICSLEWASLKAPGKLIVWTDKRDTRVELPVDEDLKRGISYIQPNSSKFCFPEQDRIARHPKKRAILSVQFGRILERAGIRDHSFHDLRHTRASELNAKGDSIEAIAEALGHSSTETTKGYIH